MKKNKNKKKTKQSVTFRYKNCINKCLACLAIQFLGDRDPAGNELPKSVMNRITLFQRKQKKDTIDVWWLYDDGGIVCVIVIPYTIFVKYDRIKRDRSNTFAAGYHQLQNKLVRDSVANILHSFWRR